MKVKSEPYKGTDVTIQRMWRLIKSPRGELSLKLRLKVEDIIRGINTRDRLSQIAAIYNWFDKHYTFVNDPIEVELIKDPERILEEIEKTGRVLGDCDDASTFLAAAVRSIGIPATLIRVGFHKKPLGKSEGPYTHVYTRTVDQYNRPITLDPVAGKRTPSMLGRIKQIKEN
jgi:transglutaminase-like putative cysteine protease